MGALLFENPECKGPLKPLNNKAQELWGMTLVTYLCSIGIMTEKGELQGRAASRQEKTASVAELSPAATDCRLALEIPQGIHFIQEGFSGIKRDWKPRA